MSEAAVENVRPCLPENRGQGVPTLGGGYTRTTKIGLRGLILPTSTMWRVMNAPAMTEACMNASIHAGHNEHTSTKKNHEESIPQAHNAFATHTWSYRRPPRDSLPSFFAMQASLWVLNSSSSLARYRAAARAPPPPARDRYSPTWRWALVRENSHLPGSWHRE